MRLLCVKQKKGGGVSLKSELGLGTGDKGKEREKPRERDAAKDGRDVIESAEPKGERDFVILTVSYSFTACSAFLKKHGADDTPYIHAVYEIPDLCHRDERHVCAVGGEDQCGAHAGTEDDTERDGMISKCNAFTTLRPRHPRYRRGLKFHKIHAVNHCICYLAMCAHVHCSIEVGFFLVLGLGLISWDLLALTWRWSWCSWPTTYILVVYNGLVCHEDQYILVHGFPVLSPPWAGHVHQKITRSEVIQVLSCIYFQRGIS